MINPVQVQLLSQARALVRDCRKGQWDVKHGKRDQDTAIKDETNGKWKIEKRISMLKCLGTQSHALSGNTLLWSLDLCSLINVYSDSEALRNPFTERDVAFELWNGEKSYSSSVGQVDVEFESRNGKWIENHSEGCSLRG